jgi:glycosyltransferase involved in cell wall biosynthesis
MASRKKLSICYIAPGQKLVSTAGSARNVLSVAEAMSEHAEVTLAFRGLAETQISAPYKVVSIENQLGQSKSAHDDVAVRGLNPLIHWRYLQQLKSFMDDCARNYDVVLEKGWRFSGFSAAHAYQKYAVPSILIENDVRYYFNKTRNVRGFMQFAAQAGSQAVAAYCSRRVPLVIAETEELRSALIGMRRINSERIEVVDLGVDHRHFFPTDQRVARLAFGMDQQKLVLLYVGGIDIYHDLEPLIDALIQCKGLEREIEFHVVGDGELRNSYQNKSVQSRFKIIFHGRVAHDVVPQYIAAADLCVAPYRRECFYNAKIAFSTLKIPEYMACAKPVASIANGNVSRLIKDHETGFLLANEASAWLRLISQLPARDRLAEMGTRAAASVAHLSWTRTAQRYLELAQNLVDHPK